MQEGQEREGERKANVATQKRHRLQTNVTGIEEDAADREKSHRLDREGESGRRRTFCTELALLFDPVRRKKCNEHAAIPMLSCDSPLSDSDWGESSLTLTFSLCAFVYDACPFLFSHNI